MTGIKIPGLKSAFGPVLKRAKAVHADLCRNSCDVPGHYRECVQEKIELDRAEKALRKLS